MTEEEEDRRTTTVGVAPPLRRMLEQAERDQVDPTDAPPPPRPQADQRQDAQQPS